MVSDKTRFFIVRDTLYMIVHNRPKRKGTEILPISFAFLFIEYGLFFSIFQIPCLVKNRLYFKIFVHAYCIYTVTNKTFKGEKFCRLPEFRVIFHIFSCCKELVNTVEPVYYGHLNLGPS